MRPDGGPRILLIVDDEPTVLQFLSTMFRRRGYDVVSVDAGGPALAVLRAQHVDGALVDFRLPDMRGDVLLAAAVALQPHLWSRTVFMTGDPSPAVREALSDSPCPIATKPFVLADLVQSVVATVGDPSGRAPPWPS